MPIPQSPWLITLQIPLLCLTNIFTLAIHPHHQGLRIALSLPVVVVLVLQSLGRQWDGNWGVHYAVNCAVMGMVFVYVDWVLLARPDREGWRRVGGGCGAVEEEASVMGGVARGNGTPNGNGITSGGVKQGDHATVVPRGFWSRTWWAVRLKFALMRYVGWSCQVKNVSVVKVHSSYPRIVFLARRTLRTAVFYLLKDAIYSYTASSPHGSWQDIKHQKGVVGFSGYPLAHRLYFTWVHIMITYVSLEFAGGAFSVVCVATGLSRPSDCPSPFGHVKDLYSLRKAWSLVWHQQCRRIASTPGIWLARDVFHYRERSFASKYVQLFAAFGVSAIVHSCASMLTHGSFNDDASFALFMTQAAIIMVEDHIIEFGKKLGLKDSQFWRSVGFLWTVFILGATSEKWVGLLIENGTWIHDREVDWFKLGPQM